MGTRGRRQQAKPWPPPMLRALLGPVPAPRRTSEAPSRPRPCSSPPNPPPRLCTFAEPGPPPPLHLSAQPNFTHIILSQQVLCNDTRPETIKIRRGIVTPATAAHRLEHYAALKNHITDERFMMGKRSRCGIKDKKAR